MPQRRKLLITTLFLAGLAAANLFAAWCLPERWDLTRQNDFTLSVETRQLLQNLEQPVVITILASREGRLAGDRHFEAARILLGELLERYRSRSTLVQVRDLDPSISADALLQQQQFPDAVAPCLVITHGQGEKSRHEILSPRELLRVRSATEHQPGSIEFLGEQAVTAALTRLSAGRKQTNIYVIEGRGELSLSRTEPGSPRGLSRLAERLRKLDCDLRPLDLSEKDIPEDAHLVLLAGPDQPSSTAESQKLRNWLANGGRALLLFDLVRDQSDRAQRLGWEELLEEYGLALGNDRVLTRSVGDTIEAASPARPAAIDHPLVRALPTSPVTLFECRTVLSMNSVRQRNVSLTPLLVSHKAPKAWAERDLRSSKPQLGADDLPGPVSMAFAVERLAGDGGQPSPALVVVGDAEFASNRALAEPAGQNGFHLILSSLNWLRGRHDLMADIRPQVRDAYRLSGDENAHRRLVWLPTLFLTATLTTAGASVWFVRRQG